MMKKKRNIATSPCGFKVLYDIHETRAYQDSDQLSARFEHIKTPINHLQDIGLSILRLIICKAWAYQDMINHSEDFGHIKTPINQSQDIGMSIL